MQRLKHVALQIRSTGILSTVMATARPKTARSTICSICQDKLTNPIRIPCLHIFCFGCIQDWIYTYATNNFKCPNCNTSHTLPLEGVSAYPSAAIPQPNGRQCIYHSSQELVKFCLKCDEKICDRCKQEKHWSHETGEIPDVKRDRLCIIESELACMSENTEELCKLHETLDNKMKENEIHKEKHIKKIKKRVKKTETHP